MGLPSKKLSVSRTRSRRAHHALTKVNLVVCSECGNKTLPHIACAKCGNFKSKKSLNKK